MPTEDTIFKRLRSATDAELRGFAGVLKVKLSGDREVDVVSLSKEFRSAAGNSFANIFRGAHELDYHAILGDAVLAAAEAAGFRVPPDSGAEEAWLEEYIAEAMCFASRPDRNTTKADAQRSAEAALRGNSSEAGVDKVTAADLAKLVAARAMASAAVALPSAAGLVSLVLGEVVVVAPVAVALGVACGAYYVACPAVKKTLPATVYLIQVRKRLEAETALREWGDG